MPSAMSAVRIAVSGSVPKYAAGPPGHEGGHLRRGVRVVHGQHGAAHDVITNAASIDGLGERLGRVLSVRAERLEPGHHDHALGHVPHDTPRAFG
jgi:hypothetical protein